MKKYIDFLSILLFATACLLIGGDVFAMKFASDEGRKQFCVETKEKMQKTKKEIEEILSKDKNNLDHTKLEKLINRYEQLKEDLDQASCDYKAPSLTISGT